MNLKDELHQFLLTPDLSPKSFNLDGSPRKRPAPPPERLARNAQMVLDYYGFGEPLWPSLDDLKAPHKLNNRQAVQQAMDTVYPRRLEAEPLPGARRAAEILAQRPFWSDDEFARELEAQGLSDIPWPMGAFLQYLRSQSLPVEHEWVLPDLKEASRFSWQSTELRFLVHKDLLDMLHEDLKAARALARRSGIAEMKELLKDRPEADLDRVEWLISFDPTSWVIQHGDEVWFNFVDADNRLLNRAGKLFALVPSCEADLLARQLANSLTRDSTTIRYPGEDVIRHWIATSASFEVEGSRVVFRGETVPLTDTDKAVCRVMQGRGAMFSTEIVDRLMKAIPIKEITAEKSIRESPLVHVDRSGGTKKFTFTLVTDLEGILPPGEVQEDLVRRSLLESLARLEATDGTTTATYRREQATLARLLFGNAAEGCCALCGRLFGTGALIAAHKKKRSTCSEAERRDPNIVMPLCVFGCDHLYETRQVRIQDGVVVTGRAPGGQTEETAIAHLLGRHLDPRWLQGPASYFADPQIDDDANLAA